MLLVRNFVTAVVNAMIADTDWLAHAVGGVSDVGLALIVAPFTPSPDIAISDLTFATDGTFLQNAVILCQSPDQLLVVDAAGNPGIMLDEPAGGFTWQLDVLPGGPLTVYGVALCRQLVATPTNLYATAALPTALEMNIVGQTVQVSSKIGFFTEPFFDVNAVVIGP